MPISPALESAIDSKMTMLLERLNNIQHKMNTLQRLIEDDVNIDASIATVDPAFDTNAMYSDIVNTLQNYIRTQAQHIVDNI